ncbi:MAG TPA: hypothetical protein VH595_13310 [Verrucomicrobiae bacterium]|nr:hypothetical protein [Verrucomicrobiae bacterium]
MLADLRLALKCRDENKIEAVLWLWHEQAVTRHADILMNQIVPRGYAVPKVDIKRLTDELRASRAQELANASEQDRARIEREIEMEVRSKIKKVELPRRRNRSHLLY